MRTMGLDLGTKTIGVAMSDPMKWIASSYVTIQRTDLQADLDALAEIIDKEEVDTIVIGLPKNMNNTEGPSAERSRSFKRELEARFALPVILEDERMSTISATRVLDESGVKRKKQKKHVDSIAATYILQMHLDRKK